MDDRHIEEAFSAVPLTESGQFTEYWDRQKRSSLDGLYTYVYTVKGVSCFLYSYSGSPEPSEEYSTNWLTLFHMPDLKQ